MNDTPTSSPLRTPRVRPLAFAARWWAPAALACALLGAPLSLRALDPTKSILQFNCQNWTRLSGLPGDRIATVTQSADGYIWLGSQNGLIRFDGTVFTSVPVRLPEAQGQDVRKLHADADGQLWFSIGGGGYGCFDGETFSPIGDPRWARAGANSTGILVANDGAIWTASVFGWRRWVKDHPELTQGDEELGTVITISEDTQGRVWLCSAERGLFYWEAGSLKRFPAEELMSCNIWAAERDRDGDLWVATNRGLHRYDPEDRLKEVLMPQEQFNALLLDTHGVLWAGTLGQGLVRYHNGQLTVLRKSDGLVSDNITSLLEDAEGSLWIGTVEGLSQLTDLKFPIFSTAEGIVGGEGLDVAASPRGGIWISTAMGASHFDGTSTTNYTDPALIPNQWVRRVFEARDGRVFLGDGNRNINVVSDGRLVARFANEFWPEGFTEDADGVLVGIGPNIHRIVRDRLEPYPFAGDAPNLEWVNNLLTTRDGVLWAATNNGLFRIEHGRAQRWSTSDGLLSNRVHCLVEDDEGCLWIGFPNGMMRVKDGRFTTFTAEDGLADNRIYAIVPDDHGALWLMSGRGVLRVSRQNLSAVAEGRSRRIHCLAYDGLESMKFTDRTDQAFSGCKTADGRIWFPNPRGVVMIDPTKHFINHVPPRVHLDRILINGEVRSREEAATLVASDRRIEFFFTALSYIAPKKMLVQFQLEGVDSSWIDAGSQRSATYSNLPAGSYTFRVRAANADGVWSAAPGVFAFELPPPFHQTVWFFALCGLAVGGSIFGGVRWKVQHLRRVQRKLEQENNLLEAKVSERTDELAHSLSLLKATLDSTEDGILALEFSGRVVTFNTQFTTLWGISVEKMADPTASVLRDFVSHQVKDPEAFLARIAELRESGETEAFDLLELKDGRVFERYIRPQRMDGKPIGIVINFRDITARRRAEAIIAESSALLESLLTYTLDVIYFKDRDSRFVRYSDAILPIYGLTDRNALRGKSDFDLFPSEHAQALFEEEQQIIRTGQPTVDLLHETRSRTGARMWVMTTKMPWRDIQGNIIGTFGVARDVTALKEAETGLAYERDLLRALLDSSPDQIYFKDRESRFLKCSQAQARNFGVTSTEDLVGKTDFDFFSEEHAREAFEDEQTIIRTGEPLIGKIEQERWRDGRESWVLTSKIPLRDPAGAIIGTIGISKDITPLKEAERKLEQIHKQLLETSRQAGMAEVATSVLHNVGNVLNSVNVAATLMAEQIRGSKSVFVPKLSALLAEHENDLAAFIATDPRGQKIPVYLKSLGEELLHEQRSLLQELGQLQKNIDHIKDIVAMQQNFAKISGVVETLPLTEIVEDAIRINASALERHQVELVRDYQAQPTVTLERHKVMQILVNLIRNAKYACDESGRTDKRMIVRLTQQDNRVLLSVIDNGVGIPPENLTRIFSHGFTTRKEGHGFGLHSGALSAKELGGSLSAHSDGPGRGAMFNLQLPLAPAASHL